MFPVLNLQHTIDGVVYICIEVQHVPVNVHRSFCARSDANISQLFVDSDSHYQPGSKTSTMRGPLSPPPVPLVLLCWIKYDDYLLIGLPKPTQIPIVDLEFKLMHIPSHNKISQWNGKCTKCGKGTYQGFSKLEHEDSVCNF